MAKIGRNDPCPCGSGKKYKRCHGLPRSQEQLAEEIRAAMEREKVLQVQRQRQQGLGRPIISTEFQGRRVVAVGNRLYISGDKKRPTFHDFLCVYIVDKFGSAWGNAQISKPLQERHPFLVWYQHVCQHQRRFVKEPGKVHFVDATGAILAYLHLAYDLFCLDHNAELQMRLLDRLRDQPNFAGARYEIFVAATLIRAGFSIEFENEDDRSRKHCVFTATYIPTGKRFSVEAKCRQGNRFRLGGLLHGALAKDAYHTRIVFIDLNWAIQANDSASTDMPRHLRRALTALRRSEGISINGKPLPPAYLFITNNPWDKNLDSTQARSSGLADGFQIPDFKGDAEFPSLRAMIEARDRHIEMEELLKSMRTHFDIPATFDGEIPEFAFGDNQPRLLIGERYLISDDDGSERAGLLTAAVVAEREQEAICFLNFEDGRLVMCKRSLSDDEMAAWRRHPDTFFGKLGQGNTSADSPLDLYDFFYNAYRETPRERLLELLAGAPDLNQLCLLDQPALVSICCERWVNAAMSREDKN